MESRMYFFVPYHLSGIQKGIQAGHAFGEYALKYFNDEDFQDFLKHHKTWILLDGGTCTSIGVTSNYEEMGSMNQIALSLGDNGVNHACFTEPDLGNALTAICFLCDERVFDWENYPSVENWLYEMGYHDFDGRAEDSKRSIYSLWESFVGGKKVAFLKELIANKRLALP